MEYGGEELIEVRLVDSGLQRLGVFLVTWVLFAVADRGNAQTIDRSGGAIMNEAGDRFPKLFHGEFMPEFMRVDPTAGLVSNAVTEDNEIVRADASLADLTYQINGDTVTITDCNQGASGVLEIPATIEGKSVTKIAQYAFYNCQLLTSVTIPPSVTEVGDRAFGWCVSLNDLTIPAGVTNIGKGVVVYCASLTSVGVESGNSHYSSFEGVLHNYARTVLLSCPGGKTGDYAITSSVAIIEQSAFSGCSLLTSVSIPAGVTQIGSDAFTRCNALVSINIPSGVTRIESGTFYWCTALRNISMSPNLTYIGAFAFYNCNVLPNISIPEGVTYIGDWVFAWSRSLASITIPASVSHIGEKVFAYCRSLASISVETGNSHFKSVGGVLHNQAQTVLLAYPGGKVGAYVIAPTVGEIVGGAFLDCRYLTNIFIPSSGNRSQGEMLK